MDEDWLGLLAAGAIDAAWDDFLGRYRRAIVATARRVLHDQDDVMDVFARVCELLREDDCRRLREYAARGEHDGRPITWVVTVARNAAIDALRRRDGRQRMPAAITAMTDRAQRIYRLLFHRNLSQIEAFGTLRSELASPPSFREFLADLRAIYRAIGGGPAAAHPTSHPFPRGWDPGVELDDLAAVTERSASLEAALAALAPEDRLLLELYVIEEMPAADVARVLGLPNAKTVYNRSYRALAVLRARLAGSDLDPTSGAD